MNPIILFAEGGAEWATCKVDGRIYKEGVYFKRKSETEKDCYCISGYKVIEYAILSPTI